MEDREGNVNKRTHDEGLEQDDHIMSNDIYTSPSKYQPHINLTLYNHNKNQHSQMINNMTTTTFRIKKNN